MATIKSYTDIEQSKKLAEILPLESADMWYQYTGISIKDGSKKPIYFPMVIRDCESDEDIPCWSLIALLNIITKQGLVDLRFLQSTYDNRGNHLTNVWCCTFENLGTVSLDLYADNPINACVELILKLNELKMS